MWARVNEAAERHNQPGAFAAFIGYKWTSGLDGNNLRGNMILRDGKMMIQQERAYTSPNWYTP
jgi:hypothetical protein